MLNDDAIEDGAWARAHSGLEDIQIILIGKHARNVPNSTPTFYQLCLSPM